MKKKELVFLQKAAAIGIANSVDREEDLYVKAKFFQDTIDVLYTVLVSFCTSMYYSTSLLLSISPPLYSLNFEKIKY